MVYYGVLGSSVDLESTIKYAQPYSHLLLDAILNTVKKQKAQEKMGQCSFTLSDLSR